MRLRWLGNLAEWPVISNRIYPKKKIFKWNFGIRVVRYGGLALLYITTLTSTSQRLSIVDDWIYSWTLIGKTDGAVLRLTELGKMIAH